MKKLITLGILAGIAINTFAALPQGPMTTQQDEQEYCPSANQLTFTPNNPSLPNSAGTITGTNQTINTNFQNYSTISPYAPMPLAYSPNVQKVAYGHPNISSYGLIAGNTISCYYTYPNFSGSLVYLVMRGTYSG